MTAAAGSEPETMTETRQRFNGEWLQQQQKQEQQVEDEDCPRETYAQL